MSGFERQRTAPSGPNPVYEGENGSHPPKSQRSVLVVGGFPCDTERDVICEKMREIFGHEQGVTDWWTRGKIGSGVDIPQKTQGKEVQPRGEAAVARLGPSKRVSLTGDEDLAHWSGGERHLVQWCPDGN